MNNYRKENKIPDAIMYIIIIVTIIMLAPLIYRFAGNYNFNPQAGFNEGESSGERALRNIRNRRRYTVTEKQVDISSLRDTDFGRLDLIAAKVTDSGSVIMFFDSPFENNERLGRAARIAVWDTENINILPRPLWSGLSSSIMAGRYVYKDYSDGTVFVSNNRSAFLFDYNNLRFAAHYILPTHLNIYQAVLSNSRHMLAIAAEEGFFVSYAYELDEDDDETFAAIKELITSSVTGGVRITARQPVWSSNDEFILYKIYAGEHVRGAGMTTVVPGGNQQLTALDSADFIFLSDEHNRIFYYFSSGGALHQENSFRGGFFDPFGDRRMTDVMRSQVYFFDIAVSRRGTHLAALSHNGNMVRAIVIDIHTKYLIYSELYDDVYTFSFSPNERNFIIHGRSQGDEVLNVIKIDWEEE